MDRKAFYDALRPTLGALTQANVVGFELVLDEAHRRATRLHDLAYILATAWWESGRTMQPVREAFWLSEAWRKKNLRYYPFYGRGLVQLTWRANYQKASDLYGVDFVKSPDLVMQPHHSVNILFDGMDQGWFTGKAMDDYIDGIDESDDEDLREFANARRVVNGTDKQIEIGKLALVFESALKAGAYGPIVIPAEPTPAPLPKPEPTMPTTTAPDGTDLTPVQQTNKANKGAQGAAVGAGGIGPGIVYLWSLTAWFPVEWASDPQAIIVLTGIASTLFGAAGAWIAAYRARDKRFTEATA